jgi:Flp pilus assembly protein TadD
MGVRTTGWTTGWIVGAVLATALAVKLAVLSALGGHPLLQPLGELDTALYVEIGRKVAAGGPLAITEPFFVSPLYVHFLAAVFALGGSIATARAAQIVLGSVAVGLVLYAARHWFGERAGWIAAALAILTGLFTFYEILILPAALDPFLVALTLAFLSRAVSDERRGWPLAAAGAAAALLALNRPNALAYGVVVSAWLAVDWALARRRRTPGRPLRQVLLFPAALALVLLPNALRNYVVSGEWILISSHGGLNFYIGNGPESDGIYSRIPGISASITGQARDASRVAEASLGRHLSAGEVSTYFYARAWRWMREHPGMAVRLFLWKLALLVNRTNVPLNFSYAFYSREETSLLRGLVVGPWLLLPLGLTGLFLRPARQTRRGFWIWASFVPVYGLTVAAFFVSSRYRMPLLVPLCASAAGAISWAYDQMTARRAFSLLVPGAAVVTLAVLVSLPLGLDDGRGFEETRQAVWFVEQGRFGDAESYIAQVEGRHTQPALLHYRVGRAYAAARRYGDAVEHFRRSLALDPAQPPADLELGQTLVVTGRFSDAVPPLTAALDAGYRPEVAAPWLVRALLRAGETARARTLLSALPTEIGQQVDPALDLGTMALEIDDPTAAERWLRLAVRADPTRSEAHEKLGIALLTQDRIDDAIGALTTACSLDPASASAHLNLAVAYARARRTADARREATEAARLDPDEPRAKALLKALGPGRRE